MQQKGQITKHEYRDSIKARGYSMKICIHCKIERWNCRQMNSRKSNIYYFVNGQTTPEQPKCITRKTQTDETEKGE